VAPIGAVMGFDTATPGIMERKPRPFNQAIIVKSMMTRLFVVGLYMAGAALILFQIGKSTKPWISEANGITLKYHKGRPIGMLLAAVTDEGKSGGLSPLVQPVAIGSQGEIKPEQGGVLYLRVNDSPAELTDNAGEVKVSVRINE
jgi:hypothetical protein